MSQNRYTYCENNPVKYSDPSGHLVTSNGAVLTQDAAGVYQNYYPSFNPAWLKPTTPPTPTTGGKKPNSNGFRGTGSGAQAAMDTFDWAAYFAEKERIRIANLTQRYQNLVISPTALAKSTTDLRAAAAKTALSQQNLTINRNAIVFGGSNSIQSDQVELFTNFGLARSSTLGQTKTGGQATSASNANSKIETEQPRYQKKISDNSPLYDRGLMVGVFADLAVTFFHGMMQSVYNGVKSATRPSNIGAGTFLKNQAAELAEVTKWSNNMAKAAENFGYVMLGVEVGTGLYHNVQADAEPSKIVADAAVDAAIGGATLLSAGIAGATLGALAGSAAPIVGNLLGAVAGFAVGVISYVIFDLEDENGETVRDKMKDGLITMLETTGEHFAQNNLTPAWGLVT